MTFAIINYEKCIFFEEKFGGFIEILIFEPKLLQANVRFALHL
jgi:hypothetical protein